MGEQVSKGVHGSMAVQREVCSDSTSSSLDGLIHFGLLRQMSCFARSYFIRSLMNHQDWGPQINASSETVDRETSLLSLCSLSVM